MSILSEFQRGRFEALVSHDTSVSIHSTIEEVYDQFQSHENEFIALLDGETLAGATSRTKTMAQLSGRYGFTLYASKNAKRYLCDEILCITNETPVRQVLQRALTQRGESEYYHDIALVDEKHRFLGLIPAHVLIRLQWELMKEDSEQIQAQRFTLETRNREIMENLTELRTSRGRWRSLFDKSPHGIVVVDQEGKIDTFNPGFRSLFGDRFEAKSSILELIDREDAVLLETCLRHACNSPLVKPLEVHAASFPSGSKRIIRTTFAWIPETGQIALTMEDVTNQRNWERSLFEKEKSKMLDNLVGGVAHELNNKLSPLLGYLSLHDPDNPDAFDLNTVAPLLKDATGEAAGIIRQLLDLSRPPALERTNRDLGELVESTIELIGIEARKTGCKLEFPASPIQPRAIVSLDPGQIRQVLMNLVLNALAAVADEEDPRVELSIATDGEYAELSVSDNGHGIHPDHLPRVFEAFFTTKGADRGTGLGLSVCNNIARLHGGDLSVSSEFGLGTRFTLRLPLADAGPCNCCIEKTAAESAASRPYEHFRVLVAEDEPFIATFLRKALENEFGIRCIVANNGEKAIELLREREFDLVISDVRMPKLDGFAVLRWIQSNAPEMEQRFLFVTGDAGGSSFEEQLQNLTPPVLRKPFVIDELSSACSGLMVPR